MSVEEAKRTALERAKIQAIADEFGTIVSQSTSTIVSNKNGESDTRFFSLGGSDVKGEWIETIETDYKLAYENDMLAVTVFVKGKVRDLPCNRIPLDIKVLRNGTDNHFEDDEFKDGDDLFIQFQSPSDGFLLIYLLDYETNNAYCLLPYNSAKDLSQIIEHDKTYIFFSKNNAPQNYKSIVDEYTLTCSNPSGKDYNEIICLFSQDALVKSNAVTTDKRCPRQVPLDEFEKWCASLQTTSLNTQKIRKPIIITN